MFYRKDQQFEKYRRQCIHNTSKSDEYRRNCNKYRIGLSTYLATFGLPPELDVDPLPNLGPKVNHNFHQNNSVYIETEHPRWGMIQSVTPKYDLKAGQELFTHYNYKKQDFPYDHPWYWKSESSKNETS